VNCFMGTLDMAKVAGVLDDHGTSHG
jgi:hypothetical protein